MLQISLVESKLVKFTPSEIEFLEGLVGEDTEVMFDKGQFWCEDLSVEVFKTEDAVIVAKCLGDSGLSVVYEQFDGSVEDVLHHCIHNLHFFNMANKKKADKQYDTVYNVFRDKKIKAPSYEVKW